jgi:serine/threonine-protein kinase
VVVVLGGVCGAGARRGGGVGTAQTHVIQTVAGYGKRGYDGDGGPDTRAKLFSPSKVVATANRVFVFADANHSAIREVNPHGIIATIAGIGQHGFSGDGGPAKQAG